MSVEQMGAPAAGPSQAELHQEVVDAQAAFDEQLQSNAELTRKIEAEHYAKAYVDAQEQLHADPEQMPFGDDEVRNASGWAGKVHVMAHRAGENAVAEHRAGVQAEVDRSDRLRAFTESREGDDWESSIAILDTVRERAEAADLADPSNPNNWREFDSLFGELRSGEQRAYTHHVDRQEAAKHDDSDIDVPLFDDDTSAGKPGTASAGEAKPAGDDDEDDSTSPTTPPTPPPPAPPTPPAAPRRKPSPHPRTPAPATTTPTVPVPAQAGPAPRRANGRRDDRYPMRGFQTWTETELDEAHARQRGEHVDEVDRLLESDYFHQIEDLDHDGLELVHLIARYNHNLATRQPTSLEDVSRLDELVDILNGNNPGLTDKLFDLYSYSGSFVNPRGEVNTTRLSPDDAEFIALLHQYKGNERNDNMRRKIRQTYARIQALEGEVPVNWRRLADGSIEPLEGSHTRNKADWLIDRHAGPTHHKIFELIAEGDMEAPLGGAERLRQRLGNAAMTGLGINAIRRKVAARRARP